MVATLSAVEMGSGRGNAWRAQGCVENATAGRRCLDGIGDRGLDWGLCRFPNNHPIEGYLINLRSEPIPQRL
jgi:hypothetical protein